MDSTKYSFFCLVCLTILFLTPSIGICGGAVFWYPDLSGGRVMSTSPEHAPDQALAQAAFKKAKELGYRPKVMYLEKEGDLEKKMIQNGQVILYSDLENDMVVNVGEFPFTISDIKLLKGEYVIFKNGKFIKQAGKITAD